MEPRHMENAFEEVRLGGPNAVIIADVFIDPANEFPILYLADTVTIPTRSHLHALDFDQHPDRPQRDGLLFVMQRLANRLIRSGSFLVLGPKLQHWLTPDELHKHVGQFVPAVISFDTLKRFDRRSNSAFDVADNFEEMSRWSKSVCNVACRLVDSSSTVGNLGVGERKEVRLGRLKCLLEVANALSAQATSGADRQAVLWSSIAVLSAF